MHPLIDRFGRRHHRLRLSVTDRCNLRCTYCMPAVGAEFVPRPTLLTFEEMALLVEILVRRAGIDGLRLTGGEPLVRRDLYKLVAMLNGIDGLDHLSLTTNAVLLADQAPELFRAGLRRVNISIDSLDRERFAELTRRDELDAVLAGIRAAIEVGMDVKLNALAIAGVTENEVLDLVHFAIDLGVTMRFIEFMPLDADRRWMAGSVLTGDQLLAILNAEFGNVYAIQRDDASQPAEEFVVGDPDSGAKVGIIRSVTQPFCGDCNRIRITADGAVRNCLFSQQETSLREMIRGGADENTILAAVAGCVSAKAAAHGHDGEGAEFAASSRAMYSIGG